MNQKKAGTHAPAFLFSAFLEHLILTQVTPLARRQLTEPDASDSHAFESYHAQADQLTHAPDLTLATFFEHEAQLIIVQPLDQRRP